MLRHSKKGWLFSLKVFINAVMKIKTEHLIILALLSLGSLSRLIPHAPNFTAVAAMALFAGAYLRPQVSLWLPVLVLFLTDWILGFHSTMVFVYAGMMLVGVLSSSFLRKDPQGVRVLGATLTGSFLFFGITNLGVFLVDDLYSKDFKGLIECYAMALPFLKNQMAGDLFFSGLLFGVMKAFRASQKSTREIFS